jgi:hypothetical protein
MASSFVATDALGHLAQDPRQNENITAHSTEEGLLWFLRPVVELSMLMANHGELYSSKPSRLLTPPQSLGLARRVVSD